MIDLDSLGDEHEEVQPTAAEPETSEPEREPEPKTATETTEPVEVDRSELANRINAETTAIRLTTTKLGTQKRLSDDQRTAAAAGFNARADRLSAGKKTIDRKNEHYREASAIINATKARWQYETIPYPEPGIRLIRTEYLPEFDNWIKDSQRALAEATDKLEESRAAIIDQAREDLGDLFDESDYPTTFRGSFSVNYTTPAIEPPNYLANLHPKIYREQQEILKKRMEAAASHLEIEFVETFQGLVSKMVDRLQPDEEGKPKVFRDSMIENMNTFFERFRSLNYNNNETLDSLVQQAQDALHGVNAKELRKDATQQQTLRETMERLNETVGSMVTDAPSRRAQLPE